MPFVKKIQVDEGEIAIWKITESPAELICEFQFSEVEQVEFAKIISARRQVEYLAIRLLLWEIFKSKTEIKYHQSGRPYLSKSHLHFSISHSSNLAVVFVSKKNCGIDTEMIDRNIDRVAQRFLHAAEAGEIEKTANRQLAKIKYWCAKEAVFKCSFEANIDFQTQIKIFPSLAKTDTIFSGQLLTKSKIENFKLSYFEYENNMVVYCVEE